MSSIEGTIWCDGCGVEITWAPSVAERRRYCCEDCRAGLVCRCGDRLEQEDDRRGHFLPEMISTMQISK